MKVLVWTTITYGAEGWSLKADDIKKIKAPEMWCLRRVLNNTFKDRRTNMCVFIWDRGGQRKRAIFSTKFHITDKRILDTLQTKMMLMSN